MNANQKPHEVQASTLDTHGRKSSAKSGHWMERLVLSALFFVFGALCASLPMPSAAKGISQSTENTSLFSSRQDEDLQAKFRAIDWSKPEPEGADEIAGSMEKNAALRAQVLQEFQRAPNGWAKHHFRELLWVAPTPELAATAHRWASDMQNPKARFNGFSLLLKLQRSESSQALVLNALFNEQDGDVLTAVLPVLTRSGVPEPRLTDMVVARLGGLNLHVQHSARSR